jgi:hypothetical protein
VAQITALKDTVPSIATELIGLVEGQSMHHAEILRRLQTAVLTGDVADVRAEFCSLDMWGGSGSVADLSLRDPRARRRSCHLLSRLNAEFRDAGFECARANQWTDVFDQWLERGVFDNVQ